MSNAKYTNKLLECNLVNCRCTCVVLHDYFAFTSILPTCKTAVHKVFQTAVLHCSLHVIYHQYNNRKLSSTPRVDCCFTGE